MTDRRRVTPVNGKRYSVVLRQRADGSQYAVHISVWMPGSYNRAGHWRPVSPTGPAGRVAEAAAIEQAKAPQ